MYGSSYERMSLSGKVLLGDGAQFSKCRTYRYALWRHLPVNSLPLVPTPPPSAALCAAAGDWRVRSVAFIGLNPSTADETKNDPTVRRCINYARAWGYHRFFMLNLFAVRATDPRVMLNHLEPVGPENISTILQVAGMSDLIVAAWGAHGAHGGQSEVMRDWFRMSKIPLYKLATTKGGEPRHPLYLKADLKPEPMPW